MMLLLQAAQTGLQPPSARAPPGSLQRPGGFRRTRAPLACRARKSRTELAEAAATSSTEAPAAEAPPPPAQQQGAQPPRLGSQQAQLDEPSLLGPRSGATAARQRAAEASQRARGQRAAASAGGSATAAEQAQQQAADHAQAQPSGPQQDGSLSQHSGSSDAQQPDASQTPEGQPGASGAAQEGQQPAGEGQQQPAEEGQQPGGTQLIFRLERRGEGWAEEILPHLVVEQRPLAPPRKKRAYSRPDPWKPGSLECYLVELGVPPEDVDRVVALAVAWRVTPGGRSLIDRRRRSRVERNVRLVVEHLELECGVPFGPRGVAAILQRCPEIMLCKPTTNDRWDRRAVELSAYLLRHGHCNVPEDWEQNPELGVWVKRQRIARAAGQLNEERLSILQSMGFAFGEVAQLTEEWEHRFDQLVDWLLWHNENQQPFSWLGADWGARGGITARELALWMTLQREFRARGLLPGEALSRFDAIGVQWDCLDGTPAERRWMSWFGRLLYVIERQISLLPRPRGAAMAALPGRRKMGRPRGSGGGGGGGEGEAAAAAAAAVSAGGDSDGELSEYPSEGEGEDSDTEEEEEEDEGLLRPRGRGSAAVAAARLRLQAEVAARRAALASADLRCEPGLRFWLARQLRRWRRQELGPEPELMLQLAGVQLDPYGPAEWQATAHAAAALLQGSAVRLGPRRVHPAKVVDPSSGGFPSSSSSGGGGGGGGGVAPAAQAAAARPAQQYRPPPTQQQQRLAPGAAAPAAAPAGSPRLRVGRWVQTQQALWAEGKLSPAQLRYMAFLGITWVLSEEVTHMAWPAWQAWCERLAAAPRPPPRGSDLAQWLAHQRGLAALGWLPPNRRAALAALGVSLDAFDRCPEDEEWDLRLSELLAFKAEHGHCRVSELAAEVGPAAAAAGSGGGGGAGGGGREAAQRKQQAPHPRWSPLAGWLAEQQRAAAAGRLLPVRAAQLSAIGAAPPAAAAATPVQPT